MQPRVFNIAPDSPFLETFVRALYEGRIVPDLSAAAGPMVLARTKIFVPTRRSARALTLELTRQSLNGALLLPTIVPLGSPDDDPAQIGDFPDSASPRTVGELERRMILAELILAWAKRLKQAVISIDADGGIRHATESLLVGTHPVDAWRLSGELASLIDEMIIENVTWKNLHNLNGDFDEYWRITLHFLDIAAEAWPAIKDERGFIDAAMGNKLAINQAIAELKHGSQAVIAIGSTGSNLMTAQLLASISRAKRGAVVLPGLDMDLDDAAFESIRHATSPTHPQTFLARLIDIIGVERAAVVPIGARSQSLTRVQFISESFRPADTTDQWLTWRSHHDSSAINRALEGISLIESANEREEALAIALCLRESLEDQNQRTALVTPDREMAKRVRTELLRWDIEIDDSGGSALGLSGAGSLARLLLKSVAGGASDWASLLSHSLATFGIGTEARRLATLFELGVLRSGLESVSSIDWIEAVEKGRQASQLRDAHPNQRSISEEDWTALKAFANRLETAVYPLRSMPDRDRLAGWVKAHRACIGMLISGDVAAPPEGEDSEALWLLFDELADAPTLSYDFDVKYYSAFFDAVIGERRLYRGERGHPRLQILGLLEARLVGASRVILGGLDESVWPPQPSSDCLLNRSMREALGLSSPDRRIGQTAHDFCQALGAPEVILTRSRKRGGAPTIASRFLQRMEALAGAEPFGEVKRRGEKWLELARYMDRAEPEAPLARPNPKPHVDLRPKSLSVTQIETLRRDPYAIYARHILRLRRLPNLDEEKGLREIGVEIHAVLEEFGRKYCFGLLPPDAREQLLALMRHRLAGFMADPEFQAFRWPRLQKGIDIYLAFETERRPYLRQLFVEQSGALSIPLNNGSNFILTCKADRIELLRSGDFAIGDYKTGDVPTYAQVSAGFSPQLTLEAAMINRGAFKGLSSGTATSAFYVPVGGSKDAAIEVKPGQQNRDMLSFPELTEKHFEELVALLNDFQDQNRGYPARPFPQFASRYNDYDHLARTREWTVANGGSDEDT